MADDQTGLYSHETTFTGQQESFERKSVEFDRIQETLERGVAGITELALTRAVMLVEDAIDGRKYNSKDDLESMKRHIWYHKWEIQIIIRIVVLLHIGMAFFEVPSTIDFSGSRWVTILWTGIIELFILAFYCVEMVYKKSFLETKHNGIWENKNYWFNWLCIVLTGLDVILGFVLVNTHYFRWSVFVRPMFVIYNFPSVRHYFKNLKNSVPDILHVFAVLFGLIMFFVLMVDVLLGSNEDPGFPNTFRAFITLYITSTTANFPDVMVYSVSNISPLWSLVFVAYATVVTKIMLSLFTAVVYNRYQYHISKDVDKVRRIRKNKLTKAFEQLDYNHTGFIALDEWTLLISHIRPSYSVEKIHLLFQLIDENGSRTVGLREFRRIVSLLRLHITMQSAQVDQDDNILKRTFPNFYRSPIFYFLKKIILSKGFGWSMDLVVLGSAISIVVFKELNITLSTRTVIESVLLSMYVGEAVSKVVTLGPYGYWSSHWNKLDGLLCITSIVSLIITLVPGVSSQGLTRVVLLLRVTRLARLGRTSNNVRSLYQTMWRLIPTFIMHALALLVVYFEFAELGMLLWAGKIYRGNPVLDGSGFQSIGFYDTSNFNSFGNSILTLFELMIQNNWHVIADAFERVSNPAAWIFFIFYNISTAVVIINILVAFILDGFITQWKLVQLQIKTKIQMRIEELSIQGAAKIQAHKDAHPDRPLPDEQVPLDSDNALDKMERLLGEEETVQNTIWTASDTSFKIDPLEFVEDDEDEDEQGPSA